MNLRASFISPHFFGKITIFKYKDVVGKYRIKIDLIFIVTEEKANNNMDIFNNKAVYKYV